MDDLERRLVELERSNAKLREELEAMRDDHDSLDQQVSRLLPLSGKLSGYVDFGFFAVQGDGSGLKTDTNEPRKFPEYKDVTGSWVFMGDPLSTAINSRGDPATTGESRAVVFDPIKNEGKSSFIVNAINMGLFAAAGESLTVTGLIDFLPRGRDVSDTKGLFLGDYIDVKLAYVEYIVPIESFKLSLFAGKFDSVLGYEYRSQEAPSRLTVTPSLICRYTCGRPLGLKARGQFFDDHLNLNVAVTNGSHATEGFPIYDEIDHNQFKTVSGRVGVSAPLGAGLEAGFSGSYGAQDLQSSNSVHQWHMGVDVHLDWHDVLFTAELVQGKMEGATEPGSPLPCNDAACLRYRGGYGLVGYRLFNWLTPYARVEFRDALHQNGGSFVYVSELMRATGGMRFEIGTHAIVKAEYTLNRELGRIPQFPNDVFTSSLVVKY